MTLAFPVTFWDMPAPSVAVCFWPGGGREERSVGKGWPVIKATVWWFLEGKGWPLRTCSAPSWEEMDFSSVQVLVKPRSLTGWVHRWHRHIQPHWWQSWWVLPLDLVWSIFHFDELLTLFRSYLFLWSLVKRCSLFWHLSLFLGPDGSWGLSLAPMNVAVE